MRQPRARQVRMYLAIVSVPVLLYWAFKFHSQDIVPVKVINESDEIASSVIKDGLGREQPIINCPDNTGRLSDQELRRILWTIYRNVSAKSDHDDDDDDDDDDVAYVTEIIEHIVSGVGVVTLRAAGLNPEYCDPKKEHSSSQNKTTRILIWTSGLFRRTRIQNWDAALEAGKYQSGSNTCLFTDDKSLLDESDVLLARINEVKSLSLGTLPQSHGANQIWIIYEQESPIYPTKPEVISAIQGHFNYSAYYSPRADINLQYGECRPLASLAMEWPTSDLSLRGFPDAMKFWNKHVPNLGAAKKKLILWFVSHCDAQSMREKYADRLAEYVPIDKFGRCGEKSAVGCESKFTCANEVNKYKFYLAFENSLCEGYVTEKPFKTLLPGTYSVPIVLGHANYEALLPPNSYIDVRNFSSPQELASHLKYLDTHDDAYNTYFEWRKYYACQFVSHPYRLCDVAHLLLGRAQHSPNMSRVFRRSENCISAAEYYKGLY